MYNSYKVSHSQPEAAQCCAIIGSYCEWRHADRSNMAGAPKSLTECCIFSNFGHFDDQLTNQEGQLKPTKTHKQT